MHTNVIIWTLFRISHLLAYIFIVESCASSRHNTSSPQVGWGGEGGGWRGRGGAGGEAGQQQRQSFASSRHNMTSSPQAGWLLLGNWAGQLVQYPSNSSSPDFLVKNIWQKHGIDFAAYLGHSFEIILVDVENWKDFKLVFIDQQRILAPKTPFILFPCLVVFPEERNELHTYWFLSARKPPTKVLTQTPFSISPCNPCSSRCCSGMGSPRWSIFQTSECQRPKHRSWKWK